MRVGEIGLAFRYGLRENGAVFDISAGGPLGVPSVLSFVFLSENGTRFTRTPTNVTDGTDGLIQWTTTASTDFTEAGRWQFQPVLTWAGGNAHYFEPKEFLIGANL